MKLGLKIIDLLSGKRNHKRDPRFRSGHETASAGNDQRQLSNSNENSIKTVARGACSSAVTLISLFFFFFFFFLGGGFGFCVGRGWGFCVCFFCFGQSVNNARKAGRDARNPNLTTLQLSKLLSPLIINSIVSAPTPIGGVAVCVQNR